MKKAENYLLNGLSEDDYFDQSDPIISYSYYEELKDIIKQAQIDAIDETVKRCAEEANLLINNLSSTHKEYNDYYQCGDDEISVNRLSILQVANKLKKELK